MPWLSDPWLRDNANPPIAPKPPPEDPKRMHITSLTASKEGISTLEAQGSDLAYTVNDNHDLYVYETPRDGDGIPSPIGVLRAKRWDTVIALDWEVR